jgi:hypothetical protein
MALSQIGERSLRQMIDRIRGINIGIPPTGTVPPVACNVQHVT